MPLEPVIHERPRIPREQCPGREEEQEPKDAEHSMSNNQLLIRLQWDRPRRTPTGGRGGITRTDLLGQIE